MITIEGYSGCHVSVERNNTGAYLVKKSCSPSYTPRLIKQKDKQIKARKSLNIQGICIPEVLYGHPSEDGGYTIGMNFYHHHDAVTYISSCEAKRIRELSNLILTFFRRSIDLCVEEGIPQPLPTEVITAKIQDVVRVLGENSVICGMEAEEGMIEYVRNTVAPTLIKILKINSDERGCIYVPMGHCHGDLTLSNILLSEGDGDSELTVVLIDFLDSFVESPLADLAKLFQDLRYGWTMRLLLSEKSTQLCPLSVFTAMEYIKQQIETEFSHLSWFKSFHGVFLVLNQLRVLQYSKDIGAAKYLFQTVRSEMATLT